MDYIRLLVISTVLLLWLCVVWEKTRRQTRRKQGDAQDSIRHERR